MRHMLSVGLLLLGLTLIGISSISEFAELNRLNQTLMQQRAQGLGRVLAAELQDEFSEFDRVGLARLIQRLGTVTHLKAAFVCDDAGVVHAATRAEHVGRPIADAAPVFATLLSPKTVPRQLHYKVTDDQRTLSAIFPLELAIPPGGSAPGRRGWLCTESDVAGQREPMLAGLLRRTTVLAVITILVCALLWFVFDRVLTRRLHRLLEATRSLAAGRLDTVAVDRGVDELGELARGFNQMAENLRTRNEALQRSEERLAQALRGSDLGTWEWHVDSGRRTADVAWARLLGLSPGDPGTDLEGWKKLIHPEDTERVQAAVESHFSGAAPFYETEYRLRHQTGKWVWVAEKGQATREGAANRPTKMAGTTRDITVRKHGELLAKAQRALLEGMAKGQDLAESLQGICAFAEANSDGMLCSVLLVDAEGKHLRHGAAPSLPNEYSQLVDGLAIGPKAGSCGTAAFRRQPVIVADIATDPLWDDFRDLAARFHLRACWSTPMAGPDGRILGTLALYYREIRHPEPEQEHVIEIATHLASIAIQRHHSEQARWAGEERLRQMFETNTAVKLVIDPKDGRIVDANAAAATFYGYSRAHLLRLGIHDINVLSPAAIAEEMARARTSCQQYFNFRHRLATGQVRDVEVYTGPLETPDGTLLFSIIHDITERKRVESALQAATTNLRELVESIPDAIFLKDGDGRWLATNRAAAQLFQIEGADWVGKTDAELAALRPALRAAHEACIVSDEKAWQGRQLRVGVERFDAPDGSWREFEVRKFPQFHDDGRRRGLVIIGREVTAQRIAEERLRQAEERFERAFTANPVAVFFSKVSDGRLLDVNDAFVSMFGYERREQVMGRTSLELNMWDDAGDRGALSQALLETGRLRDVECRFRRRSGEPGLALASIECIELNGEPCVLSFLTDITERRRSEVFRETVLNLEVQLSAANTPREAARIIFSAAEKLWSWDAGYLEVYSWDEDLCQSVLEYDVIDGRRQEIAEVLPPHPPSARSRRVMRQGAEILRRHTPADALPDATPFGDTSRPSASLLTVPVRWKSRPVGVLSIQSYTRDVFTERDLDTLQGLADHCGGTLERLRAAEAFLRSEARLAEVFASLDDVVFVLSAAADGGLVYESFNPRCEQVTGLRSAEVLGRSPVEVLPAESAAELMPRFRACLETGVVVRYETDLTYQPGRRSWSTTLVPIADERGRVHRIAGISRDITDRRQMEQQLRQSQKMEAIGQLAGGIAHDFNNMLTAIILQAQVARLDHTLPEDVGEALTEIVKTAERSASLTRQLLLFSRRQVMQLTEVDLNNVVSTISSMLRRVLGENIALELRLCPGEARVNADAGMLDQVIINLAVNARDAMPRGGRLMIETDRVPADAPAVTSRVGAPPGEYLVLRVRDTGTGIPPEVLPHIFEPFFTTKEVGKGTGLGLATVFGIVEQHNGWIEARNDASRGAVFEIYLPATRTSEPVAADQSPVPEYQRGTETILLVEDEPAIRVTARVMLEKCGYRVYDAPDGLTALEIWQRHLGAIDLLLTDLVMPGNINGRELAQQIRAADPELKVIYTTGYSRDVAGRDFELQAGRNLLSKPFGPEELLTMVRRVLGS